MRIKKVFILVLFLGLLTFSYSLNFNREIKFEAEEKSEHYYSLLDNDEKAFYDKLAVMRKDKLFINNKHIELYPNVVSHDDLVNYINGSSDLYRILNNAVEAFFLDYPDMFYVDRLKIGVRIYQDDDNAYHVELGSGRLVSALKDEYLSSTTINTEISSYSDAVDKIYKDIRNLSLDEIKTYYLLNNLDEGKLHLALDKMDIDSYLVRSGNDYLLYVLDEENKYVSFSGEDEYQYSYGKYYFDYIEKSYPIVLDAIDNLDDNFYLGVKEVEDGYQLISNYDTNIWALFPYPNGESFGKSNISVLSDGETVETFNTSLGVIAYVSSNSLCSFESLEKVASEERIAFILESYSVEVEKKSGSILPEKNLKFNAYVENKMVLDNVLLNGFVLSSADKNNLNIIINYDDIRDTSVIFINSCEKNRKTLSIKETYEVNKEITFNVNIIGDAFAYEGDLVVLYCETDAVGTLSYEWYKDGELIENIDSSILVISSMQKEFSGKYSVKVTSTSDFGQSTIQSEDFLVTMTVINNSYSIWYIVLLGTILFASFVVLYVIDDMKDKQKQGLHK